MKALLLFEGFFNQALPLQRSHSDWRILAQRSNSHNCLQMSFGNCVAMPFASALKIEFVI
jgi:hypothetical protein